MTDYQKIIDVMCWEVYEGETPEQAFTREARNNTPPPNEVIDIVHAGGLQKWAESLNVNSEKELYDRIIGAMRKTVSDPIFNDRQRVNNFPPFANFFISCRSIDRNGKTASEAEKISEYVWNTVICRRNLAVNVARMFTNQPDHEKFKTACNRISDIWGFNFKEIDAIRYFVCQTRHTKHNPSLNKSIYLWGKEKQTGKTTIARAIVTILNGDKFDNFGNYESTLHSEMQYNDHDIPASAFCNAVLLDEAMPKDSRKSYGLIKQVLTSDMCKYNQKFGSITRIPCKRYYFCTSNDDIEDFIQDATERRFFAINVERKPEQISFDEIYQIWFDFCTNAVPEDDWQIWYNSFDFVDGLAMKDMNEIKNEIILRKNELFSTLQGAGTYFTIKQLASQLFKNEPTREQKKSVAYAVTEMFSDCKCKSNKALFSKSMCYEKLQEQDNEQDNEGVEPETNMPF